MIWRVHGGELAYLTPEARARVEIDWMLPAAGWAVQNAGSVSLAASRGVAVREFVMKPPHGRADYLLSVDGRASGVVEAKKVGATLIGVEWQSAKYVDGLPSPAAELNSGLAVAGSGRDRWGPARIADRGAAERVQAVRCSPTILADERLNEAGGNRRSYAVPV